MDLLFKLFTYFCLIASGVFFERGEILTAITIVIMGFAVVWAIKDEKSV